MEHDKKNVREEKRAELLEDVRRRLKDGELDSDDAVLDTAQAILDGD